jgi:lipopolysaccharide transport system ATP-binding protein
VEPVLTTKNLGKCYRLYGTGWNRMKETLSFGRKQYHSEVWALRDVNLEVGHGTTLGLVGPNGAGKSTLLKILSGTTFPSHGSYQLRGRVASLLELGAGFHQFFSGRDNIFMNAAMMGFSHSETQRKYQEIVDFSELHEFIHAPIRTYSSGMICRLGFSCAIAVDPDVLIIDEILAVGDMHFQRKCVERIWDFKNRGKTIIFCSHSLYDVRQLCNEALWIQDGNVKLQGDAITVTNEYATYEKQLIGKQMDLLKGLPGVQVEEPNVPHVVSATLVDGRTGEARSVFKPGEAVDVVVRYKNAPEPIPVCFGIGFTRSDTTLCFAHTTEMDGVQVSGREGTVTLHLPAVKLLSGEFVVFVWLMDRTGVHRYHQSMCDKNLVVQNRGKEVGLFLQEHSWTVRDTDGLREKVGAGAADGRA